MSSEFMQFAWLMANLVTGVSYYLIPYEMWRWTKGIDMRGLHLIIALIAAFVCLCGAHHLVMLRMYHNHAVDHIQLGVDVSLAVVSAAVAFVFYALRSKINEVLRSLLPELE